MLFLNPIKQYQLNQQRHGFDVPSWEKKKDESTIEINGSVNNIEEMFGCC